MYMCYLLWKIERKRRVFPHHIWRAWLVHSPKWPQTEGGEEKIISYFVSVWSCSVCSSLSVVIVVVVFSLFVVMLFCTLATSRVIISFTVSSIRLSIWEWYCLYRGRNKKHLVTLPWNALKINTGHFYNILILYFILIFYTLFVLNECIAIGQLYNIFCKITNVTTLTIRVITITSY